MSKHLPVTIQNLLISVFSFPEKILIGQLANRTAEGPWQRSLRIYGIEDGFGMVFITHRSSRKWEQIQNDNLVSVCLVSSDYRVQITARCHVSVLCKEGHENLFRKYWEMVRTDVRKFYLDSHEALDREALKEPGQNVGILAAVPIYWESLVLEDEYLESKRFQYEKQKGTWKESQIPL